jgi:TRAP-type mannitol/chloroaromatic compound transport system permease small subunit
MSRLAGRLDTLCVNVGVVLAWLGIPLMVVFAALEPLSRWLGWGGDAPFGEASTVAFLALTMTSFGYAYAAGSHVRLDILSRRFPGRLNQAIELAGALLIVLPLCALIVLDGTESAWRSFQQGERWADSSWALQWTVRIWIPVGFLLLGLAAIASAMRSVLSLFRK